MKRTERAEVIAGDLEIYAGRHRADLIRNVDPDTGGPVQHLRVRDQWPLDRLRDQDAIDDAQYAAGRRFRDDFDRAQLHGLRAMDPAKPVVDGAAFERLPADAAVAARESIGQAMRAVGIVASSCIWHVVGEGVSIADWVTRQRGSGVRMNKDRAWGILIGALSALVSHYGIDRRAKVAAGKG